METEVKSTEKYKLEGNKLDKILADFKLACLSRELSILMRKEVLTGKAKFGIGGAGKELPLIALSKYFKKGDYWSGYYRDQTFMFAKGIAEPEDFFSTLYGDSENDKFSGGRQMNNHYATEMVDKKGKWIDQSEKYNVTSAISPLAGHVPRALGIALASKAYKNNEFLFNQTKFSNTGDEISFCIIGDASTSEGVFFESVNAAGVLQVPIAFIILDDGYGISVPAKYQTTKQSISEILKGFQDEALSPGLDIYKVNAWDYAKMKKVFKHGINKIRQTSTPAIFHITECTQPQGHSTSGSHQRYKSKERLLWETEKDGIPRLKNWINENSDCTIAELEAIESTAKKEALQAKSEAWSRYQDPILEQKHLLITIFDDLINQNPHYTFLEDHKKAIEESVNIEMSGLLDQAEKVHFYFYTRSIKCKDLKNWIDTNLNKLRKFYNTKLYNEGPQSALNVPVIPKSFSKDSKELSGYQILNTYFDQLLRRDPRVYAFGEDVGKIGDVNQAFIGLQAKYGENRVFDTGIREWTIVGQAIGMAMRGLRPIAEIQYLDYVAYAFAALTDDLATLHYRSNGKQSSPAIIRTRGHRLEGIWHSGSPMGMLLHSMRGIYILTPRNMVQAAGMYNTLSQADDPAIMIECLNGYRKKELLPDNMGEYTVPLGVPEIIKSGEDVSIVSYGSSLEVVENAVQLLEEQSISCEIIDVQTLLPFDLEHRIVDSLKKTNKLVIVDEDVPGGASAFILQKIIEEQKGYYFLDRPPLTITSKEHRAAYADNGNYMSKPQVMDVLKGVYSLVYEEDIPSL